MILWPFYPRDQFFLGGGSQPMVGGNWLKSIFFLFLDHLPGFPNYTFLNFPKKFFSLHPSGYPAVFQYEADSDFNFFKTESGAEPDLIKVLFNEFLLYTNHISMKQYTILG